MSSGSGSGSGSELDPIPIPIPINPPWWYEFIPLWITIALTTAIIGLLAWLFTLTGTGGNCSNVGL